MKSADVGYCLSRALADNSFVIEDGFAVRKEGGLQRTTTLLKWPGQKPPIMNDEDNTLAVETNQLTRTFGNLQAGSAVNLRVKKGQFYGFLGPNNGAGKSPPSKC